MIERAVLLSQNQRLAFDLPVAKTAGKIQPERFVKDRSIAPDKILTADEFKRIERDNMMRALEQAAHKIYGSGGAAELLGMKPTTLLSKLKALGIQTAKF